MVSVDGSIFIQIVNFIVLIWVLNMVLYKPIRKILAQRREKVAGFGRGIEACITDANAKKEAFSEGIKQARAKGVLAKDVLREEAAHEEKGMIDEIMQKAQADLAEVRAKIAKDADDVRLALEKEVDSFADEICKKILGRAV